MPYLSELQVEAIKAHMLHQEDALKIKFKAKNTEFDTITVPHNEVESYENMGYVVQRTSTRKSTMVKKKNHDRQFEDDIWCMFYKLGFRILNRDEDLRIKIRATLKDLYLGKEYEFIYEKIELADKGLVAIGKK